MTRATTPQPLNVLQTNVAPETIAAQYLKHEFIKIFPNQKPAFYDQLFSACDTLPDHLNETFWPLVAGLSEGYKLKWIYRTLTNTAYTWQLEELALDTITMTGMSPFMDAIIHQAAGKPSRFAALWKANPHYAQEPIAKGIKPEPLRDNYPILIKERSNQLQVFDGMRRTCVAAINGTSTMRAWVGRLAQPGKPYINPDKPMFIMATYIEAETHDPALLEAIAVVFKGLIANHANGKQAIDRALQSWDKNPTYAKTIANLRQRLGI